MNIHALDPVPFILSLHISPTIPSPNPPILLLPRTIRIRILVCLVRCRTGTIRASYLVAAFKFVFTHESGTCTS